MANINNLSLGFCVEMILYRRRQFIEQRAWERYLVDYGHMNKKTFKPYKPPEQIQKISRRPAEEILKKASDFIMRLRKNGDI